MHGCLCCALCSITRDRSRPHQAHMVLARCSIRLLRSGVGFPAVCFVLPSVTMDRVDKDRSSAGSMEEHEAEEEPERCRVGCVCPPRALYRPGWFGTRCL